MSSGTGNRSYDRTRGSTSRSQDSFVMHHSDADRFRTTSQDAYGQQPKSSQSSRTSSHQTYDHESLTHGSHGYDSHGYRLHGSHTQGSHGNGAHVQAQQHILRNAQASKQMVYDVYGNTITMLEELENRELREQGSRSLGRSDIYIPSQGAHDTATIQRKLDTQLLLLQSQLQSCDKGILADVKEGLKKKTLDWTSQREAHKIKKGNADKYTGKLYEVLATGKTDHPDEFYKTPSISEQDMQKTMGVFMHGSQIRHNLDSSFRNDPNKQAVAPNIRAGAGTDLGADRMIKERPDLATDIKQFRRFDNR